MMETVTFRKAGLYAAQPNLCEVFWKDSVVGTTLPSNLCANLRYDPSSRISKWKMLSARKSHTWSSPFYMESPSTTVMCFLKVVTMC
jgi:hypothetical protein